MKPLTGEAEVIEEVLFRLRAAPPRRSALLPGGGCTLRWRGRLFRRASPGCSAGTWTNNVVRGLSAGPDASSRSRGAELQLPRRGCELRRRRPPDVTADLS